MARLTVSIPDELHERLERWRDHLNISRVCQDALAKEVRRLEELPRDAAALAELVQRLSQEKAGAEQRWFAQGVTDGMTWTRGASYVDLVAVAEACAEQPPSARAALRKAIAKHAAKPGFERDLYTEGWRLAASEVWARVKTKI